MKILVIGGTGTISTSVVDLLAKQEHEVFIANRGLRKQALPPGVTRLIGDRQKVDAFTRLVRAHAPYDAVIDMICFTPEDAEYDINLFAPITRQLIFTSTVDVYQKDGIHMPLDYPVSEAAPRNPAPGFLYAVNKLACERIFLAAHERGELPVTVIRPGLTYREGGGPLHPLFGGSYHVDRLRKGKPIVLHGDGTALWTALHADDAAVAYANAIGNERTFGRGYTVASPEWLSWEYYWRTFATAAGVQDPKFIHIPTDVLTEIAPGIATWIPIHFQYHAIFDISAARAELGFSPRIRWEEGARRLVAWLDSNGGPDDCESHPEIDVLIEAWRAGVELMSDRLRGVPGL